MKSVAKLLLRFLLFSGGNIHLDTQAFSLICKMVCVSKKKSICTLLEMGDMKQIRIGIDVFQYEKFLPKQFQKETFEPLNFNQRKFEADTLGIHILRRGVIGVSEIGYV